MRCSELLVILGLVLLLGPLNLHALDTGTQEFYVPGRASQLYGMFDYIDGQETLANFVNTEQMASIISLSAGLDNQYVVYDHWEDGYEADIANPVQASTETYALNSGEVLELRSDGSGGGINDFIPVAPRGTGLRYDGGDRIYTVGGAVSASHMFYPEDGTYIGGAFEIISTEAWTTGTFYSIPVGEDSYVNGGGDTGLFGDFKYVYTQITAVQDNTIVTIDNGIDAPVIITLDAGETYSSLGFENESSSTALTINEGTTVSSTSPVQLGLVTGADGTFQTRTYNMLPDSILGNRYIMPVSSASASDVEMFIYNPNATPMTVNYSDADGAGSFIVPAGGVVAYSDAVGNFVPEASSVVLSSDLNFSVMYSGDTSNTTYDWGGVLFASKYLTDDITVPSAPGTSEAVPSSNGSPIYVAPTTSLTEFFVDYSPTDGVIDYQFTLDINENALIFDPDGDNSGMRIWATSPFAAAWGPDPDSSGTTSPYWDLGYSLTPTTDAFISALLTVDLACAPLYIPMGGGTISATVSTMAEGGAVDGVDLFLDIPTGFTYVAGTAIVTYPNQSTVQLEPTLSSGGGVDTLTWDLSQDLGAYETMTVDLQITSSAGPEGFWTLTGRSQGTSGGNILNPEDNELISQMPFEIQMEVSPPAGSTANNAAAGDVLTYTIKAKKVEVSSANLNQLYVYAPLPEELTYVPNSQSPTNRARWDEAMRTVFWGPYVMNKNVIDTNWRLFTFQATVNTVPANTQIEVHGELTAQGIPTAESNTVVTTVLGPTIAIAKTGPATIGMGGDIMYTITFSNPSAVAVTGVVVTDPIPADTTYVPGSMLLDGSPLTDAGGDDEGEFTGGAVVINLASPLAGFGSGTLSFHVTGPAVMPALRYVSNYATMDCNETQPVTSDSVATYITDLVVGLSADVSVAGPGDVITYTVTADNVGGATQNSIVLSCNVPANTTYNNDATGGATEAGGTVTLNVGDLTAASSASFQFSVDVDTPLAGGTNITNSSLATSTQEPGGVFGTTVIIPTINLTLSKVADVATGNPGDTISYTLTYTNSGSIDATNVVITDAVDAQTTYTGGTIYGAGADDGDPANLQWVIGLLPAGTGGQLAGFDATINVGAAGNISNQAALASDQQNLFSPTTSVVVATGGIVLSAGPGGMSQFGQANQGEFIYYSFTVTNTGAVNDWAELSAVHATWATGVTFYIDSDSDGNYDASDIELTDTKAAGPNTPVLGPGVSMDILAAVEVPAGAADDEFHNTTITATSFNAPAQSSSIVAESWVINPLYAKVALLKAEWTGDDVLISWTTGYEMDNLGFNVYRQNADGSYVQLNAAIIPSLAIGIGSTPYEFLDASAIAGTDHLYLLEDVDLYGNTSLHGPFGTGAIQEAGGDGGLIEINNAAQPNAGGPGMVSSSSDSSAGGCTAGEGYASAYILLLGTLLILRRPKPRAQKIRRKSRD